MATSPLDYILQGARKILDKGQEAFRDDSSALGIAKNTFAPSSLLSATNKLFFEQSTAPQQYLKKVTGLKSPAETQRELLATTRANQLPTQRLDQFGLPASTIGKQTTKVTDILKTATPKEKELLALSQARNLTAGFAGYAPQKKALTSIAPQVAKSTDIGKIANLLKKEIPSLADDTANNFARVFKDLTDPKAIDTAINKIKFQAQGKTTGMADDLITNVKAIMETGKPLPVYTNKGLPALTKKTPSTPVLPSKLLPVASKVELPKIRQMKTSAEIPSLERTAEMQGVTPKTSETKLPKQTQGGVEKAQQGYTNRQNPTPTTPLKSSSYKDNTTAMIERKRAFDIPTTPLGIYGKLQQSLSPVKFLDEVSQKIYKNWSRAVEKAKVLGDKELSTFKIPTKDSWQSILDYQAGKKTSLTSEIKNKFDSLFKEAGARGLDIGYNERYLPQVYKESADEIKDKITQYLLKNGMSKEEILAYQNGKKISDDIARRLKLNPFFSKEKVFPDYKTAMEYGLTPKYTDLNQLVAHYRKEMETTLANRNFIESLINTDKLLLVDDAPSNWKPVELPFSIKGYYAEPRLAKVLNGLFGSDKGFLDTIFSVGASASRRAQEISLSAGIPYTSVNFFSIGQLIKEMTSGNFKSVVPFIRSNFGDKSLQYFTQNRNYLEMMADEGLRLGNHIGTLGNTYKNLTKPNTLWESLGLKFDKAFNEKTFASFMPQLYTQTFKDIYLQGIKSGLAEQEAKKLAGDTVKKAFGLIEDFGRSKKTEDKLSAVFFAPKFREGVVNTLKNTAKAGVEFVSKLGGARAKLDPSFSKNRKLLAGMIVTYGVYNLINYALNSNFMWDNPENRKFALQIPTKGGGLIYIEFMPSFLSFGRNMISGGLNLATGDIKGATQKFGSLFSMPVKTTTEIIANKDYFGNEIYKNEDSVSVKALKIAKYVGLAVNHPYIKEIVNQIGDKKPLSQSAVVALELPIKFGSVQKVAQSKGFSGTLTLEDIQKSIKADVEAGKIDADAAVASYIGQKLRLAESHKKYRLDLPLGDYKKALAQDIKDGLITEEEGVDEYIQYKTEKEQQAKRDEQMRETYPDRNLVKLFVDYAKAYKTDPVNAWKAMFTKEKLDQVKGGKVTLQRFFGKHYLDSKEGSEAYMKKELNKLGISWNDRANYNLEHIIPLTAGGDNSSNNLQIISRELHDSYTPVDIKAGKAVESGKLSRRQVANIIRQLKIDKTITINEALNML